MNISLDAELYEVKYTAAPSVYIESEFHDVAIVAKWIIEHVEDIAEAICKGICAYFGVSYKAPAAAKAVATPAPAANTIYKCGEVTSLTISNPPANRAYSITFTSGSTPTDLSIDPAIKMPDGFSVEANRIYEINVLDNRAAVGSWAVSA